MGEATFGKYRLIAELGHGGMADVFLAVQAGPAGSGFRKLTVVKRLRPNLADEPEFVAMLVDEARIAARLNHPNVVQTNEVGHVGQHYFIAMEYLDGQPLHRIQHRSTQRSKDGSPAPISKEQQYVVIMDALAGLHHAHELADYDGTPLQIVHRDMTPHNIFVTYAGQVKVVDFGIAKAAGRSSETRQGVVKGKVRYMAPEQAVGQPVDRRADLFSVGVMLWEMAVGRRMWKDMDDMQIVHALVAGEIPSSPRAIDPNVPEALDKICAKALAHNAQDRYETADDFRADIEQFLAESGQLVDARRKLAPSVGELFKDKRTEIKSVIEKQLALLDEKASGEFQAIAIPTESHVSGPTPVSLAVGVESQTVMSNQATEVYDPSGRAARDAAAQRGRVGKIATIAAAGALSAAALLLVWRASSAPNQPAQPTTVETTAAQAQEIDVRLDVTPSSARVYIDDEPARQPPVAIKVPKDERDHRVRIEADGFVTRNEVVRFQSDVAMSFDLHPVPEPSSSAKAKVKPPVTVVTVVRTVTAPPPKTQETATTAPPPPPPPTNDKQHGSNPYKKEPDKNDPWATK